MPNDYFQFKQFRIDQDKCAMKVSTEACILGAFVHSTHPIRILDIGAGTGLVGLMLAQRFNGQIDAVEIDESACQQATQNIANSPWSDRFSVFHQDIFDFVPESGKYDLIVSNPPFFTASLKSGHRQKDLAKHDTGQFDKKRFAQLLPKLLTDEGTAYVLYPAHESNEFTALAISAGLFSRPAFLIHNQPSGPIFRVILRITKSESQEETKTLNIRVGNDYSAEFIKLLSPYYLHL